MKTHFLSKEQGYKGRKWVVVDAAGQTLGRLSTKIASLLRGKHRTSFTPNVDCGDFVVVINAAKVRLSGKKLSDKIYFDHSGWAGGIRETTAGEMLKKKPEDVIYRAVQGMIPVGPLGYDVLKKLKIYKGADHPHQAQMPEAVSAGK